jgi:transposase-like protein
MTSTSRVSTALLRKMYEQDRLSTPQIGSLVGMPDATVAYRLKSAGVVLRARGTAWAEQRRARLPLLTRENVTRLYVRDGLSLVAVAEQLATDKSTVRRFMIRHNIRRRRRSYAAFAESRYVLQVNDKEMAEDYTVHRLTIAGVARKHGVSKELARLILLRNGVVLRKRSDYAPNNQHNRSKAAVGGSATRSAYAAEGVVAMGGGA